MLISELATRTGVSSRALRHYDGCGLLPSRRRSNGYRDFPPEAIERVRRIRLLLEVGLDLVAVASLLPCFAEDGRLAPCEPAQERLRAQIRSIDASMATMRETRRMLVAELGAELGAGEPGATAGLVAEVGAASGRPA
ncbi:MerR family transcriptional regulator [Kitasatospora mediocidica]|uniref:MerR family transcriptional regulator n=1 Tax=Kitasatospora mediocidica TaxID=58352 RepID=UPI0007C7BF97|nr:MerR family transcriptional regulator [Kitasatospora mediocidica]